MRGVIELAVIPLLATLARPSPAGPPAWLESTERTVAADTLEGWVMARGGEPPVAGAEVRLMPGREAEVRRSRADSSGRYVFVDLSPGRYEIYVTAEGFRPMELTVSFPGRGRFRVDVWLDPAERDETGELI